MTRLSAKLVVAIVLAIVPLADPGAMSVVLVTGNNCPMEKISTLDVRKIYLSFGVNFDNQNIRAFRIANDEQLNQIFLQTVVAMSRNTYERRLLRALLRSGRPRPEEFEDIERLSAAIVRTRCSIAYMWQTDVDTLGNIKVLKVLWQEN